MNNKLIAIIVVGIIIASLFYFVSTTSASTVIETPFGEMRVEIIATDSDGNHRVLEPTSSLEYYHNDEEMQYITVNLYVTAMGGGYATAEFDMTVENALRLDVPMNDPLISAYNPWSGEDIWSCTLYQETLFRTEVWDLNDYTYLFDIYQEQWWETMVHYIAPEFTFRGVESDGTPGPWQTYDASFQIETGWLLQWLPDECGDGECGYTETCLNCPYDCGICCGDGECESEHAENCWSCPIDCGGNCYAHVATQTWNVNGNIIQDTCSPRMHRYDEDLGWEDWQYFHRTGSCTSTPEYTVPFWIMPFGPQFAIMVWVWPQSSGTLTTSCTMKDENGVVKELYFTDWSDIRPGGTEVSANNWYSCGFWTGCDWCDLPHVITEEGDWDLTIDTTLSSAGTNTLRIEPQEMLNDGQGNPLPEVSCNGITDEFYPYTFELNGNVNYNVHIDWYGNGETTTTHSVYLPYHDYTYSAPHPDKWLIHVTAIPESYYDWCIFNPALGSDCSYEHLMFVSWYNRYSTSYPYTITLIEPGGDIHTHDIDITSGDDGFYIFNLFENLQIIPSGGYLISGLNSFKEYSQGDNYLGVI